MEGWAKLSSKCSRFLQQKISLQATTVTAAAAKEVVATFVEWNVAEPRRLVHSSHQRWPCLQQTEILACVGP